MNLQDRILELERMINHQRSEIGENKVLLSDIKKCVMQKGTVSPKTAGEIMKEEMNIIESRVYETFLVTGVTPSLSIPVDYRTYSTYQDLATGILQYNKYASVVWIINREIDTIAFFSSESGSLQALINKIQQCSL